MRGMRWGALVTSMIDMLLLPRARRTIPVPRSQLIAHLVSGLRQFPLKNGHPYLQTQEGGRTQTLAEPSNEFSPGVQTAGCPALQVTEHLGHGGGPSTLQEDGFVMSHPGVVVAVGVATFDLVFSPPTADMGKSTIAINEIITAIILSFI